MEYNPMEELGFIEDKQFISNCNGFISKNDNAKRMCGKFIRNGERFFDVVSRYDDIASYALNRDDSKNCTALKMIVPFLKAYGVTDHMAYEFSKEDLKLVPGADSTIRYLYELLPTFVTTGSFEHHMMAVCDSIKFPMTNVSCTRVEFDSMELDRQEAKSLREMAAKITSLHVPRTMYTLTEAKTLDDEDTKIITELDKIFQDTIPDMGIEDDLKNVIQMGANEKAYALLEIRRKTEIEFNSTAYVGTGISDYQALDLVRDSDGLAVSFNGGEFAVRGCNVAVMGNNAIAVGVLAAEFYNEGIEAVYDLIENWDRDKLKAHKCSDRHLMDAMLKAYPKKLPRVVKVDRHNVDDITLESEEYRRKVMR